MNIFFTSDTHFYHRNVIAYCNRPYSSVEEMNEALIENWNKTVKPTDKIYHLGDFGFCSFEKAKIIFDRLNGIKLTTPGNHDRSSFKNLGWECSMKLQTLSPALEYLDPSVPTLVMNHYPNLTPKHGEILLHGHAHGRSPHTKFKIDVGVDCWNYHPVSLEEILAYADSWVPLHELHSNTDYSYDVI